MKIAIRLRVSLPGDSEWMAFVQFSSLDSSSS